MNIWIVHFEVFVFKTSFCVCLLYKQSPIRENKVCQLGGEKGESILEKGFSL